MRVEELETMFWNTRWFLFFQITQIEANQMIMKN